eukprot:6182814-Pleurochrysis_carterae.AAC.1
MVALVAVEAAFASVASTRRSSLPLPSQARAYVRRAAEHEMVCKIKVIILRSVASMSSGAIMYRLDSSAERGGRPVLGTVEAGAAAGGAAGAADDWD